MALSHRALRMAMIGNIFYAQQQIIALHQQANGGIRMKKGMIYLIAISALLSALMSGCGESVVKNPNTNAPTTVPDVTMRPEIGEPDVSDGVVKDTDGMITEGDSGSGKNVMDIPDKNAAGTGVGNKANSGATPDKRAGMK